MLTKLQVFRLLNVRLTVRNYYYKFDHVFSNKLTDNFMLFRAYAGLYVQAKLGSLQYCAAVDELFGH